MNPPGPSTPGRGRAVGLQILGIMALTGFSCFTTSGYFLRQHDLYGDNLHFYSTVHANLHSLNRFGEPAWWFPHNQYGSPGYVYAVLGDINAGSPAFVLTGAASWLLGRLGIPLASIQTLYVLYFGALVPFFFLLGVWSVAGLIFRSRLVVWFLLIGAAFSPAVLINISDVGFLEPAAYGLWAVGAYLRFLKSPHRASYGILVLALCLLALSVNYTFLVWNALFLPMVVLLTCLRAGGRRRLRAAFGGVRWTRHAAAGLLVVACAAAPLIAWSQAGEWVHPEIRSVHYPYGLLKGGNPLELLLASTPGVGFNWDSYEVTPEHSVPQFKVQSLRSHGSYHYLGLLALPLFIAGLGLARRGPRLLLLVMSVLTFGVIVLGAYSPLFSLMLVLPTPLQSVNHFGDLTYVAGGILVLGLGMGWGLEGLLRATPRQAGLFAGGLILWSLASLGVYGAIDPDGLRGTLPGFLLLMTLLYAGFLGCFARESSPRARERWGPLLLLLTAIDLSTVAFWHVRTMTFHSHGKDFDALRADGVGLKHPEPNTRADSLLRWRTLLQLEEARIPVESLPRFALYGSIHDGEVPALTDFDAAVAPEGPGRSLGVAASALRDPAFRPFASGTGPSGSDSVHLRSLTYNEMRLAVTCKSSRILFVRDGYSPYWRAWANGAEIPVARALGHFKALVVPAGTSEIFLRFEPPHLAAGLALGYAILLGVGIYCIALTSKSRRAAPRP